MKQPKVKQLNEERQTNEKEQTLKKRTKENPEKIDAVKREGNKRGETDRKRSRLKEEAHQKDK